MRSVVAGRRARRVVALLAVLPFALTVASAVPLDPSGDLDTTFSADGKTTSNFSNVLSFAEARGVAIQPSGKIVIGGSSVDGGFNNHFALIRLNTDGTQDMSFGEGGVAKQSLSTFELINDVKVQPDGRIVAAGWGSYASNDFIVARYTVDGAPDTTFGAPNGYVAVDFAGQQDRANGLAIQDDGKIVVVGYRQDNATTGRDVALVRLNTNGSLDGTFGTGGKVVTPVAPGTGDDRGSAVVVVGSGASRKILVGGRTRPGDGPNLLLVRYTDSGALDGTFGTGGIQTHDIPGNGCDVGYGCGEEIRDLALQADGKIVAAGSWTTVDNPINKNPKSTMLTARFTSTGAFDSSFDADGRVITSVVPSFLTDIGESVAVQADGKIVSFGWSDQNGTDHDFIFVRLNTDGSRDSSYGTGSPLPGVVLVELSDGASFDDGDALVLDAAGRAVGVGLRTAGSNSYIGAARLTTSGALDTTFGPDGSDPDALPDGYFVTQLIGGSRDEAGGVAVQGDGKVVVAGWTDVGSNSFDFAVARYDASGGLDPTFGGGDGLAGGSNATENDTGRAVALQADGKIVVAGDSYGSLTPSFTVMRFTTTGALDAGFDSDGVATATFGSNGNQAYAVALQPDGKILVGGSVSDVSSNWDFGLARFNPNGSLDSTFDGDGKARLSIGSFDEIHAIALQPDGKLVVGGRSSSGSHFYFALARYNANGSLDTTFASPNGYLTTRMSDPANTFAGDEVRGILVLPDGRIVAGGKGLNAAGLNAFALARFNSNGSLDTTLDGDGKILVNLGGNNQDEITGIALQLDEKVVGFGTSYSFTTGAQDFGLVRFNWDDGSLDTTWGTGGVATTDFAGFDRAAAGVVLAGGRALAAGTSGGSDFAVARYLGDPAPTVPGGGAAPDLAPASDSGVSSTDDVTNDTTPTFFGTCVTGETIVLRVAGLETAPRSRARCVGGVYAATIAASLADGVWPITAVSVNGAGTSAATLGLSVTIDTVALPPTITAPAEGSVVSPGPTVSGAGAEPAAAVTVREGATTVCGGGATVAGAWSCASTLGPGAHSLTATQTDVAGNTSAASSARSFTIKAPTSTTLSASGSPTVFGQAVTFTATVASAFGTPDGTVDLVVDGGAAVPVVLTGGVANLVRSDLAVGPHTVTASYLGSTGYFASADGPLAHTVLKASTTTLVASSANPSVFGQPVTLTATVAAVAPGAGVPSGTVTFKEGATILASLPLDGSGQATFSSSSFPVGSHPVTVDYAGNGSFNPSASLALDQVVEKASTATGVVSSANPSVFGQSVTFTATVSVSSPGAGLPTGTVTFKDGATTLGTDVLDGAGQATLVVADFVVGAYSVTAEYGGDVTFGASTSSALPQTVDKAATTAAVASSANPSVFGQSVTFTATVVASAPGSGTPTGTVTFRDGATMLAAVALDGSGQAALSTSGLAVGVHALAAEYAGDPSFGASTSPPLGQTVGASPTTTTLTSSANPSTFGDPVTLTATVVVVAPGEGIPTGSIAFMDGAATLGTVALDGSGQATLTTSALAVGPHTLVAQYAGDASFDASTSSPLNQAVQLVANLSVTKDDGRGTVAPGGTTTYTIVVRNDGPSDVTGATVSDPLPFSIAGAAWTCVSAGGGSCAASGSGSLADNVDLPAGATVTYALVATIATSSVATSLVNTVTVTLPATHTDPDATDNSATDVDAVGAVADFNGDGRPDFPFQHTDGRLRAWFMDGVSRTGAAPFAPDRVSPDWRLAATADLDGDGKTDLIGQHADGRVSAWLMDGTARTATVPLVPGSVNKAWRLAAMADFDGDGKPDVLWQRRNGMTIWYMDGVVRVGAEAVDPAENTDQRAVGAGDFNGDGKPDILWQRVDGRVTVWYMDGATRIGVQALQPALEAGTGWKVAGVADFDDNGTPDLLWQKGTGHMIVWFMDGPNRLTRAATVPGKIGSAWRLAGPK